LNINVLQHQPYDADTALLSNIARMYTILRTDLHECRVLRLSTSPNRGFPSGLVALRADESVRPYTVKIKLPLAVNDFAAYDAASGVARVDDQLRFLHDTGVVVIGVVGDDDRAVVFAQIG